MLSCATRSPEDLQRRLVAHAIDTIVEHHISDIAPRALREACAAAVDANAHACLRAMVARLGPDADLLDRDAMAGTGIEFARGTRPVRIARVLAAGPARRADIRAGDVLVAIDGRDATSLADAELIRALHGPAGSRVALRVRDASGLERDVAVERADVFPEDEPTWRLARGEIVYVRIERFGADVGAQLARAIRAATAGSEGRVAALVVDLRANEGGPLIASVAIAAAFLPASATVVEFSGRAPGANLKLTADRGHAFRGEPDPLEGLRHVLLAVPLAIWVDANSAGGAAIAAAALQDHGRATIVGSPTQGRNLVTTLLALPASSVVLRIPTARWRRPSGADARVLPNLVIELPADVAPDDTILATIVEAMGIIGQPAGRAPRRPAAARR